MKVVTKNNVTARGKQGILLLMDEKDQEHFKSIIVNDILSMANCAIYSPEGSEEIVVERFVASVLIVTENLIENKGSVFQIYHELSSKHVPIIPIALQQEIISRFNKEYEKIHCILRNDKDSLEKYYKELKTLLNNIMQSDETILKIKEAFDCHVFLSYRKNSAEKAKKVISFLRQNRKLTEAAIWYDDYLIPGNNYEVQIEEEIKNCDCFVLAVTNDIISRSMCEENEKFQDNYVVRVEYPLALKYQKLIIPIIVDDNVEKELLAEKFDKIGELIRYGEKYKLEQKIEAISKGKGDSYSQYLKGVAFCNGIFTETDLNKGLKLLKKAANNGQKDAVVKLAQMYYEGNRVPQNWREAAKYYKKLIDEVEKDGSIIKYPYCYNNYAVASDNSGFNRNYGELIGVLENGIEVLRESMVEEKEYLFYYALTLADYQKIVFQALYDESLEDAEQWLKMQDRAYNEAIAILNRLLQLDEFEEKYRRLKVTLEKEVAEHSALPEIQHMYNAINSDNSAETSSVRKMYANAIADMRILYELNPLETEGEYIDLLYQASVKNLFGDVKDIVIEWMQECLNVCEKAVEGRRGDDNIKVYKNKTIFIQDYYRLTLATFIKKYNKIIHNGEEFIVFGIRNLLFAVEAYHLSKNEGVEDAIYQEIGITIDSVKRISLRDEEHINYVLLSLEYAYKGDVERNPIEPNDYFLACRHNRFFGSLEQRCFLGNQMTRMAVRLCEKGMGYDSALNCLNSALELLGEIAKKNHSYMADLEITLYIKNTLEDWAPVLKLKTNIRLMFDVEQIVSSKGSDGVFIVELKQE